MKWLPAKRKPLIFHGAAFQVDPEWQKALADISLSADSDWTTLRSEESTSKSYHTTAGYRLLLNNGQHVYFKRYVYKKPRIKYWLQPSKAVVEATGLQELESLGITTVQTLAYGEKRSFGLIRAAFIVTLGIPNTTQLDLFLLKEWRHLPQSQKRQQLAIIKPQLLKQLITAHAAGFFHHDLKLRNILLQKMDDHYRLIWIDCPRSRCCKPLGQKAIVQDLAAMARVAIHVLTAGQRMRFLLDYCANNRTLARQYWLAVSKEFSKRPPRPSWHFIPEDKRHQQLKK